MPTVGNIAADIIYFCLSLKIARVNIFLFTVFCLRGKQNILNNFGFENMGKKLWDVFFTLNQCVNEQDYFKTSSLTPRAQLEACF